MNTESAAFENSCFLPCRLGHGGKFFGRLNSLPSLLTGVIERYLPAESPEQLRPFTLFFYQTLSIASLILFWPRDCVLLYSASKTGFVRETLSICREILYSKQNRFE